MDKHIINSPSKKVKQTSLSDFYRKPQSSDIQPFNIQSPSNLSLTPSKLKSHKNHLHKLEGNIASLQGSSRHYHSLAGIEEDRTLELSSNLKLKTGDIFGGERSSILTPNNDNNIVIDEPVFQQNLFTKPSPNNYHNNAPQNKNFPQPKPSQMTTKRFDNSYSDLDLNLSVEPQEIKLPEVKRYQNILNQFKLHQDDRIDGRFLIITPENSQIKSPEKFLPIDTKHFTPLQSQKYDERNPPTSQIIQRLRFNTENVQETTEKKNQQLYGYQEKSPGKKSIPRSEPFDKHLESYPSSLKKYPNKIPSPTKSSHKKSPSIQQSPMNSPSKGQGSDNKQILSSDDEDSTQILSKIRQLLSQVSQLKSHKYQFAINKYQQETRYELQKHLQSSVKEINSSYDMKVATLRKQAQTQSQLYTKSLEDIGKYKKTYAIILGQLKENRQKIEQEYRQKVEQVNKFKERLIHDWRRQSNEEVKKILNQTHGKHSFRLGEEKERSKQKTRRAASKERISPLNISK